MQSDLSVRDLRHHGRQTAHQSSQLQKPLAIHQQATAGQGDSLHPVIFSPQKRLQAALKIPIKALCFLLGQIEAGVHFKGLL